MRKFLSMIISMVLVLTVLISSLAITAFSETTSVNKLVAFGDSVIFGACMGSGPNTAADAYGDQKVTDLIGKEFGLTRQASTKSNRTMRKNGFLTTQCPALLLIIFATIK